MNVRLRMYEYYSNLGTIYAKGLWSRALLVLLFGPSFLPAKEHFAKISKTPPQVTKNEKVLGKTVNFFRRKRAKTHA